MLKSIDNISINCQSSIKITDGLTIYFDPYDIKEKVSNAGYIFITHPHWDHLDIDSINNIANEKTIIIGPSCVIEKLNKSFYLLEVEPNKTYNLDNISFKTVPSYNIGRNYHPKDAGYVGYLLNLNDITYYIPGDTDVIEELKELTADVIFLPVGGTYTMTREEAVGLANTIKPIYAIPIHYGLAVGNREDAKYFVNNIDKEIKSKIFY
ncbi:MAG TPA: MBL fold metallo-hydrolase [Candidatus Onthousia faecipullorum]|uniref:MBL fold metallo-hydrolase n=1 Tax=Candidatus Onthousia faecipullorum TaxID=2840887 RepID=A0A9D1G9M2_9FIRM|nr:MBL fold metallo-hydrolase [Candidatus Onthousia faecipullorum]